MDNKQQRDRRKALAVRDAHRVQGLLQIYWMHAVRHIGLNFQGAYYMATALAWIWYACKRTQIELVAQFSLS